MIASRCHNAGRCIRVPLPGASLLLLVAFLPSLLFFGHWELSVAIPGTGYRVGVPVAPEAARDGHEAEGSHESHCHESAASCSDTPLTGISWIAHLSEAIAFIGLSGVLIGIGMTTWLPLRGRCVRPEVPPPDLSLLACAVNARTVSSPSAQCRVWTAKG